MEYAIIETGGKQYKVQPGNILNVERLEEGSDVTFDKILLYVNGEEIEVGKPYVSGLSVKAKKVADVKGEKIHVVKFKAKAKYRRAAGHRQSLSQVEILSIGKAKAEKKQTSAKSSKAKA